MTLERASEIISLLREAQDISACDLFDHFVDFFNLQSEEQLVHFAELCGFPVITNVQPL